MSELSHQQRAFLAHMRAERQEWLERRRLVSTFRTDVIELVARMEPSIDLALALHHARTVDTAYSLLADVFWRIPLEVRVEQFGRALDDVGLSDTYPFAIPITHEVLRTRNLMAHSITTPTVEGVWVYGRRRGQRTAKLLDNEYLKWLTRQGERYDHELDLIAGRIGDWRVWASLHGFDDRSRAAD